MTAAQGFVLVPKPTLSGIARPPGPHPPSLASQAHLTATSAAGAKGAKGAAAAPKPAAAGKGAAAGAGPALDEEGALRIIQAVMSGRPDKAVAEQQLRDAVAKVGFGAVWA